jgi:hypothetical protein
MRFVRKTFSKNILADLSLPDELIALASQKSLFNTIYLY